MGALMKFRFSLFVACVFSYTATSQVLFTPYTALDLFLSHTDSFDSESQLGFTIVGQSFDARLSPSGAGITGFYSPFSKDSEISTGWLLGMAFGRADQVEIEGYTFAPSQIFYEFSLGRKLLDPYQTGMAGNFEVSFRGHRTDSESLTQGQDLGLDILKVSNSIIFRAGGGFGPFGTGIVKQRPELFAFRFDTAAALPFFGRNPVIFVLRPQVSTECGFESFFCGLYISYMGFIDAESTAEVQEIDFRFNFGPQFFYFTNWGAKISLGIPWTWVHGSSQEGGAPSGRPSISRISKMPGIEIRLSQTF